MFFQSYLQQFVPKMYPLIQECLALFRAVVPSMIIRLKLNKKKLIFLKCRLDNLTLNNTFLKKRRHKWYSIKNDLYLFCTKSILSDNRQKHVGK